MKKIKKVNTIEVKRCFVVSQLIRLQKGNRSYLGLISNNDFQKKLKKTKIKVSKFTEDELDVFIFNGKKNKNKLNERLNSYNRCDWYMGEFSTKEVGVWRRAGGLPLDYTNGSLKETSIKVKNALINNPKMIKKRAGHTIENILKTNVNDLQKEKYLFPILFKGGVGTNGRRRLKRQMKGDIDDGCMRSIALTISGVKNIKSYIGFPKIIKNQKENNLK